MKQNMKQNMKKIGLFYAAKAEKTSQVAEKIREVMGKEEVEAVSIEDAWKKDFEGYEHLIVGASTWFDGELPTYWDELMPEVQTLKFKGKKVALFGLGDQVHYADNFVDGLGILGEAFEQAGATLVGFTSTEGYAFNRSRALRSDSSGSSKWCGLVIDLENQSELTDQRIKEWCKQVKAEF